MSNESLKKLHQVLIDTGSGYRKAAEEAERSDLRALFHDIASRRAADHDAVHAMLAKKGETPDDKGSFMETVHRTVVGARAATLGLDETSLPSFVSGEDHVLNAYDAALAEQGASPEVAETLSRQRAGVVAHIEAMQRKASQ